MTRRWVCVHGHFYQPPRENPWLDEIEPQPSAAPFPDWNARITAECYRPNTAARIVDGQGDIIAIVDNYARMSWNVGPTLFTWMARHAPDVHAALIAADRASVAALGHGAALAQAHGHLIMPLCTPRDRQTQVRWGLADFRHRFGRDAEGMWLPECAVDTATLEALAAEGVAFTILAPHQAARVRPPGGAWRDVDGAEPGRIYRCPLPSGRTIDLCFYDGPLARAVAFEKLLADGGGFARRLVASGSDAAPLCHIATDGETYGHHHRYGDMALAWALASIAKGDHPGAALTNYGAYRAAHPATWEVAIREDTAWSCAHGIERWRSDCGCNSGGRPGWNQAWRQPLRDALDWLRDRSDDLLDTVGATLCHAPWEARDAYVDVLLTGDRAGFLARHARPGADPVRVLSLMEMSRHAMAMYTSCGWFFDDLGGIETVQVLRYAARVAELGEALGGHPLTAGLVDRLAAARSNERQVGDGRSVWQRMVEPARVDLAKVVANHAVVLAVTGHEPVDDAGAYAVTVGEMVRRRVGRAALAAGVAQSRELATGATRELAVAVLHVGDHQVLGGVIPFPGAAAWDAQVDELTDAFAAADLIAVQRAIDRGFAGATFSLATLLPHDRELVLAAVLAAPLAEVERAHQAIYDDHAPVIRFLVASRLPVPPVFARAATHVLEARLTGELGAPRPRIDVVRATLVEAGQLAVDLDTPAVAYLAGAALHRAIAQLDHGEDPVPLERLAKLAEIAARMKSAVDLWDAQNAAWQLRSYLPRWQAAAAAGDDRAARSHAAFVRLAHAIRVKVG
ncbi:MAG: DUF3536 domain-containing protein [Myxococcales bacterium]|nr:DUF3536 domain-containing protein [Myxococcales bacterium]MBP6847639.1 DUF3536 domain-containing protein [Kofleriaceae bacterium]